VEIEIPNEGNPDKELGFNGSDEIRRSNVKKTPFQFDHYEP
jgi:hypothetical protein